jgi:hypothetical protein
MKMREKSSGYAKKKTLVVVEFAWQKRKERFCTNFEYKERDRCNPLTYTQVCASNATIPTCVHVCASNATSPTYLHVCASNATSPTGLHVHASNASTQLVLHVRESNGYGCSGEREGETPCTRVSTLSTWTHQLQKYTPFTVLLWACLLELDQYIYI